ncbi:MAG TPA: hypothetical protein VIQ29_25120 [Ancylobacter sp.]
MARHTRDHRGFTPEDDDSVFSSVLIAADAHEIATLQNVTTTALLQHLSDFHIV